MSTTKVVYYRQGSWVRLPPGELGAKIREHREAKRLSQAQFAVHIGVTGQGLVSDWETGRRSPSVETLHRIAEALGVQVDAFFGGKIAERAKAAARELDSPARTVYAGADRLLHTISMAIRDGHMTLEQGIATVREVANAFVPEARVMADLWIEKAQRNGRRFVEGYYNREPETSLV